MSYYRKLLDRELRPFYSSAHRVKVSIRSHLFPERGNER